MWFSKLFFGSFLLACLRLIVSLIIGNSEGSTAGNSPRPKASRDKQVYRFPEPGNLDVKTFDPALVSDIVSFHAIQCVFTGLVSLNNDLQVQPQLAESYEQSADGPSWTFKLKPNLTFSDGTLLTAEDVVYSINRALSPGTRSTTAPLYLQLIKDSEKLLAGEVKTLIGSSLVAAAPDKVIIHTNKNVAYFLQTLSFPISYIVNRRLIEKYGEAFTDHLEEGGGAGPFKVERWQKGRHVTFIPNEHYYGATPQLQRVVMIFYPTVQEAYRAYENGEIDDTVVPPAYIDEARSRVGEFISIPRLATRYYAMNYLTKPFDNIKIRQAFALAVDKEAITNTIHAGTVIPIHNIVPKGVPGHFPDLTGPAATRSLQGDPLKARQLLAEGMIEAGYNDIADLQPIVFTYRLNSPNLNKQIAATIQRWKAILDVDVKIRTIEDYTLLEEQEATVGNPNGLQLWETDWTSDYPDPQNWLTLFFDEGSLYNYVNYGQNISSHAAWQQQVQAILRAADAERDQAKRFALYHEAEQQLVNDVAWLPMYQTMSNVLLRPYVVGRQFNGQGIIPPDDWAKIYIAES